MGAKLRQTRRRIRSIESTKRITKAMELIAASRILRAQQMVRQSRPYAELITQVIQNVASQIDEVAHPMLEQRSTPTSAAVVVVTSDRGLAGAYNSNVLRTTEELLTRVRGHGLEPKMFVTGRKGISYFRFRERPVEAEWRGFSETPSYDDAKTVADAVIEAFTSGAVDEIHLAYTEFASAMVQRPVARRLVPMVVEETAERPPGPLPLYIFEPAPEKILADLLPRYVEARVYSAMLESAASEQAARRRAMSAATDNAEELIKVLTRVANQARQSEITQEIMEIVGGAEAMSGQGA
jgi:F-type H+-transporting ATPase subunit gamma